MGPWYCTRAAWYCTPACHLMDAAYLQLKKQTIMGMQCAALCGSCCSAVQRACAHVYRLYRRHVLARQAGMSCLGPKDPLAITGAGQ